MKKVALTSLALALALAAPSAFAQCPPGSWLCADITIGTPAPPVVVQPPPPPVMVQPPVVYVQPPPPPRVVYVQQPPVVVYQPVPQYQLPPPTRAVYQPQPQRNVWVGLQGALSGAFLDTGTGVNGPGFLGGGNVGLRFRGRGNFGGEIALGLFGGRDFNGDGRTEVPVTANALFFVNPQNSFQFYLLAGLGLSFANVDYSANNRAAHGGRSGDEYSYFGGDAGLGAELQLNPRFSLFADARVFVRTRVDSSRESNPEFARTLSSGATQTTNTSAGVLTQIGAALYF